MKAKVSRAAAALTFLLVTNLRVVAQQPQSNPAPQGSAPLPGAPSLTESSAANRTVLKVGARSVTQADVELLIHNMDPQSRKALAQQGLRVLGEQYALMLVLAEDATSKHLDQSVDFRRQMAAQQERMLAQAELQDLEQHAKVTPEEISQYYAAHDTDFNEVQVRQIAVRTKPQSAKEGTQGLTLEEGRARAEAIKKALASGTDAKQVAKDFGIANQVLVDPEPRTLRQSASLPEFQKAAFKLKDGEFTETQQVGDALVALQVAGHRRIELKDASQEIENILRKQKLDAEIAELKNKSGTWIDESYFKSSSAPGATAAPQSNPPARP